MNKLIAYMLGAVALVGQANAQPTNTPSPPDAGWTNSVLREQDVQGLKEKHIMRRQWVGGIDGSNRPHGSNGVVQELVIEGVKVRIHYAEFASSNAAHAAVVFQSTNNAAVFADGIWDIGKKPAFVDESWFAEDASSTSVLLRCGRVSILVSCRGKDAKEHRKVAELLVSRVSQKAFASQRVELPK